MNEKNVGQVTRTRKGRPHFRGQLLCPNKLHTYPRRETCELAKGNVMRGVFLGMGGKKSGRERVIAKMGWRPRKDKAVQIIDVREEEG